MPPFSPAGTRSQRRASGRWPGSAADRIEGRNLSPIGDPAVPRPRPGRALVEPLAQSGRGSRADRTVEHLSMVAQDLRHAGRRLRRTPVITATVVLTLGLIRTTARADASIRPGLTTTQKLCYA